MKAAVTSSMSTQPPDPLKEFLKVADMFVAGSTCFMEFHKFVTIEGMMMFRPSKAQDLMKIYNCQTTRQISKFGMAVQKILVSFIYWVSDLQKSQKPIIYTLWTHPKLVLSVQ